MSITYTSAASRTKRRSQGNRWRVAAPDLLLTMASLVAVFGIALASAGSLRAHDDDHASRAGRAAVNLNAVHDAAELESVLSSRFDERDRRLIARELVRFLNDSRRLPNVGALSHATVRADVIERLRGSTVLTERLESTRADAAKAGRAAPAAVPLLTSADLQALKPGFVVRTGGEFRRQVWIFGLLYVLGFHLVSWTWRLRNIRGDRLMLSIVHVMTAIGFAVLLARPDPLRDTFLFVRYTEGILLGLAFMTAISLIDFAAAGSMELSYVPLIGGLSLSAMLILFGSGPSGSAAKVNLGLVQPIEAIRLLLALFLAGYFARHWEVLRGVREQTIRNVRVPSWISLPRLEYTLPVLTGVGTALVFFFLQKDFGPALFICCVFLAAYAVARARIGMAIAGLALLAAGFYVGHLLGVSQTLADRLSMWQSPWNNAVAGGDQVAHAVWAMATGGATGTGLGLGDTRYLPAGHTDLILAGIGEELGVTGLAMVAALYGLLAWRGFRTARLAATDYGFFLAAVLTLFLIVPALIMAAGVSGIAPLTGVVTPFLSYGGSAMTANFMALGLLASVRSDRRAPADATPFRVPMRSLAAVLAVGAVALVAVVIDVQVVRADSFVVRPHLGVQADGGRRFQYNPRVINLLRDAPRGTVYDRQGFPLATEDPAVVAGANATLHKANAGCPNPAQRCYPLGGRAFHLIGDVRSRVNWAAPNTSYIERDAEDRLRGFDDRAETVQTLDTAGRPMLTVRRDYRDLVPVLRHRHDPNHPAVVAFHNRSRDLRTTLSAELQVRAATIVSAYARKAGGKAAAVVIDPDTGALLASVSYPWPEMESEDAAFPARAASVGALLDRARYGLYPPGSTFKLVTAVAALRRDRDRHDSTFSCARLPDGRVGARIPGWGRTVRDDVRDTVPHGTIDMREGLVHSCNAYFAQLAVRVGAEPLIETAGRLGIALTDSGTTVRRVRETLPQVGYGQADVLATPLRMARVAAAIAADGVLRDVRWDPAPPAASNNQQLLDADSARLLAGYMRDAVISGTGRTLRDHPGRIAGKTGTAEITGKPSHSWFVGFAPYGPATRRVAFAVIIENAGYGSASAAPAAGEIVTAAAVAGLLK